MGHLQSTTERIAAEEAAAAETDMPDKANVVALVQPEPAAPVVVDPRSLPAHGDTVLYFVGQFRNGADRWPAIVTKRHPDGTLDLVVVFDSDDFMGQRKVPRRADNSPNSRGWEQRQDSEARRVEDRFERFMEEMGQVLFGEHGKPDQSYEDRMQALEAFAAPRTAPIAKAPAKKKRGKQQG